VVDAGTTENSLVLAVFYQRGGRWRFRAVGQGYEEPLAGSPSATGSTLPNNGCSGTTGRGGGTPRRGTVRS